MKTKTLYLVRHAKSSWKDHELTDHDRPLNKRGIRDAPRMGKYLIAENYKPEKIISSTAVRAFTTANILAEELGYAKHDIVTDNRIYDAWPSQIMEIIEELDKTIESVMIIGHNPTITELVMQLTDPNILNVPTCGIAIIQFKTDSWTDLESKSPHLHHYAYPKMLDD